MEIAPFNPLLMCIRKPSAGQKIMLKKGLSAGATTHAGYRGAKPHFPSGMPVDSGLRSLPLATTPQNTPCSDPIQGGGADSRAGSRGVILGIDGYEIHTGLNMTSIKGPRRRPKPSLGWFKHVAQE